MRTVINKGTFKFTVNRVFTKVITHCKDSIRDGQPGSWINENIISAYVDLHKRGYANSAEAWSDGVLVGGLYGVRLGNLFFGESMFSLVSNASKFAFISYINLLRQEGVTLVDCQVYTSHLSTLGARMITREEFLKKLDEDLLVV